MPFLVRTLRGDGRNGSYEEQKETNGSLIGFSFSGEVREPFPAVIQALEETKLPVTSVDAPSSWNIESGPPSDGVGSKFMPTALISLTAPKPLVQHFKGRHFVGGRHVPKFPCSMSRFLTNKLLQICAPFYCRKVWV